jgi:hypothetical protein
MDQRGLTLFSVFLVFSVPLDSEESTRRHWELILAGSGAKLLE